MVELFLRKKYDNLLFNFKKQKNNLGNLLSNPNRKIVVYPTRLNIVTGGYFIELTQEKSMWFGFWFWPNLTQSDPCIRYTPILQCFFVVG
jgi:hypothetical protein